MIQHLVWHSFASGLVDAIIAKAASITGVSDRQMLFEHNSWQGYIAVSSVAALGYVTPNETVQAIYNQLRDNIVANPSLKDQSIPMVTGAGTSGDPPDTLIADTPPSGYTVFVYSFDSGTRVFSEVGALDSNSQPGAGVYVLAHKEEGGGTVPSFPSLFLTLSA